MINLKLIKKSIFFILFLFICISISTNILCAFSKSNDSQDLYPVLNKNNQLAFINETGKIIVNFKPKEFDYWGNFSEGKVFLAKKIKELKEEGIYKNILVSLYIMNFKGNIITKIPCNVVIGINQDLGEDDMPEFYEDKAIINLKDNTSIIVNDKGEVISKSKQGYIIEDRSNINIDYINNKERIRNMEYLSPSSKYKMDKDGPFPYLVNNGTGDCHCSLGCINYSDKKGKTVIELNTCNPGGSGDYTIDPYFYNGVAMVFGDIPDPTRRFINKNGEYINNETYLTATPFWKKLAGVIKLNEDFGYINTNGEEIKINKK